jgi:hypothetical protein
MAIESSRTRQWAPESEEILDLFLLPSVFLLESQVVVDVRFPETSFV